MKAFALFGGFALGIISSAPAAQSALPPVSAEARVALADAARCVVLASPAKAHVALTRDFTTSQYRQGLRVLAVNNARCFNGRGMRAGGLPVAAAMAEALLKQGAEPLNLRLLRAAPTAAPTFAPSDKVAMCVARSDADGVAALFATPIASAAETSSASALGPVVRRCTPPGVAVDLTPFALRSILATASYRLLAAAGVRR